MAKRGVVTGTALLLGLFAVIVVASASRAGTQTNSAAEVAIDNFSFTPDTLTVNAGSTVTWVNHDDLPHTIASDDKVFKSRALDTDEKFTYTFTKPGTYAYFCSLHPKMVAKIVVR